MPGEVCVGCYKNPGDVALRDMVSGHGDDRLMIRLDDLRDLFQP